MASAFWWASHMVARLLSAKLSIFPFWGALPLKGWGLPDGASLWLQMPFPPPALGGLQGRTAPLQVVQVPQEETQEVYEVCKPPGIAPADLLWMFLDSPAEQQVCPPPGSAEATSAGGLGGLFVLPPSALQQLHAGTFHALSPSNEDCLLPTGPGPQGRAPHPLLTQFLGPASAHQQPLLSDLELLPLAAIFLNHQSMITTGNEGTNE